MARYVRATFWAVLAAGLGGSAGFVANHMVKVTVAGSVVVVGLWVAACLCAPMFCHTLTDGAK